MEAEEIKAIGIVGAGLMGHGIAQVFGMKGYRVNLYDKDPGTLKDAPGKIRENLQLFLEAELINNSDLESCMKNINLCHRVADLCKGMDVVIESVSEKLEVKQLVFSELERYTSPQTLLCTNTSGIRIAKISEGLKNKNRVVGAHFWNPPHTVPCVEVIKSEYTSDEAFQTILDLMKRVGKEPVRVLKDVPGFLGNRLQLALFREALFLFQQGIASPEDIDRVVKYSFGSRFPFIGAFETMDLAGHDLGHEVQNYLFPELCSDLKPLNILKRMVEDGLLGVKTGKGFYEWSDEKIRDTIRRRDLGLLTLAKLRDGR